MQHEVADKRVYCHESLHHYQAKLQSASHGMQVAACDSSDRDDSKQSDADDDNEIADNRPHEVGT